ncbi:MAG: response regulator [Candidatus Margulisiibacteriota bacterium]
MAKPLILVVDDEKAVADSIARIIRGTGRYETAVAYSAREGLELLAKNKVFWGLGGNKIKLIILDIKMPEMDGLQFLEKIRKEYREDIGVTMLTAYEDEEKWERATNGFVINYIKKPFEPENLIGTIDKFFAGKEVEMVLNTIEKHIEKQKEWKKQKG